MRCPKCESSKNVKSGRACDRQRYKCKGCGCFYTRSSRYRTPRSVRRMAIALYLEGLGFRSIERVLGVSNVTVMRWVREMGLSLRAQRAQKPDPVRIMEIDEMWHYVGKKNSKSGCGSLMIVIEDASLTSNLVGVISPPDTDS